ncbi:MAG: CvpA family protein, partial [Candidatus Dormiibacterota bacterium]
MNLIDLVIVAALVLAAVQGHRHGFVYSVLSLLGLVAGLLLGSWLATAVGARLQGLAANERTVIVVALVVAIAFLGHSVG